MAQLYSGVGGDVRLTEANALLHTLLVDLFDPFSLMVDLGDAAGSGSSVAQISKVDLDDPLAATTEGNTVSATDPTFSSASVTVAWQALRRDVSDLLRLTGAPGMWAMDPGQVAMDARNAVAIRRAALLAALFPSVSNSVGTSGADMTVTDFQDAIFQLQNTRNAPPFIAVIHPQQLNDLQKDIRSESGVLQFHAPSAEMLQAKGPGFAGNYMGVDIYTSDQVTASGGNRLGCMFSRGAFGYREASIGALPVADRLVGVPGAARAAIELERDGAAGLTRYIYHYYVGVVEIEDDRAVQIATDQ